MVLYVSVTSFVKGVPGIGLGSEDMAFRRARDGIELSTEFSILIRVNLSRRGATTEGGILAARGLMLFKHSNQFLKLNVGMRHGYGELVRTI